MRRKLKSLLTFLPLFTTQAFAEDLPEITETSNVSFEIFGISYYTIFSIIILGLATLYLLKKK